MIFMGEFLGWVCLETLNRSYPQYQLDGYPGKDEEQEHDDRHLHHSSISFFNTARRCSMTFKRVLSFRASLFRSDSSFWSFFLCR